MKTFLQHANSQSQRNIQDFPREAKLSAEDALADNRVFGLDEARWQAFQDLLDRPASVKPRLQRLVADDSVPE